MSNISDCVSSEDETLFNRDITISLETLPYKCNAWSSIYRGQHKGRPVSVKVWRGEGLLSPSRERTEFLRNLEREVRVWQAMSHPNIGTVHGMLFAPSNLPSVVAPYYPNGDINTYVSNNLCTNLKALLLGVAAGLQYLHQLNPPISHGDVRGCNIFITNNGVPVLTDIGLSFLPVPPDWTIPSGDGARWLAPEVMDPHSTKSSSKFDCHTTTMSDVYSFGMTMLEVYTGQVPFSHRRFYAGVVLDVLRGIRPRRPNAESSASLTDEIWCIIQSCWTQDPSQRPTMESITSWLRLMIRVESAACLL
ncbi:kinase-like domain-containing protein [Lentinula aff. detonsa]|uniref:Kinase-like domain-containing protein n=1 Tax=Lentinula aff. detonsa TaxID=2804958 RepID=A0AA38KU76_9AGAR|nr:kinase-like domain-containing protein [Lentinula aff. detonsa]